MIKTYTYKVKHTDKFVDKFNKWIGVCRFVYNCAKELKEINYKKGVKLSSFDIQKQLTEAKKDVKFISEVHSQTLQSMIDRLDLAYQKYFRDFKSGLVEQKKQQYIKKKTKNGGVVSMNKLINLCKPKWATKKKYNSIPFKSITIKENGFYLPKFGKIKVFNFKSPKGVLKTATLIKEADGYYIKIVVDEIKEKKKIEDRDKQSICSIDMGVKYFMVTSDGEFFENPKHIFDFLKKIRIENRKLSRMKKGGANFNKQVERLQRLYQKLTRVRLDYLHKTSTYIANNYDYVIVEDLNISGMVKNKNLSKHILDCSWSTFFNLLSYKTEVIKVNPKYTSQKCFKCGHTEKANRPTQSIFECVNCGHSDNADLNATNNLMELGQQLLYDNVNH